MLCEDKSLNGNWVLAHLHAAETVTTLQDQQQDSIFHIKGPRKAQSTASPSKSITVLPLFQLFPLPSSLSFYTETEKLRFDKTAGKHKDTDILFMILKICLPN